MEKSNIPEVIAATYGAAFVIGCTSMEESNTHGE